MYINLSAIVLSLQILVVNVYLLYSGMGVGVLSGSAVVDTQLGGYQVVFVKSPDKKKIC